MPAPCAAHMGDTRCPAQGHLDSPLGSQCFQTLRQQEGMAPPSSRTEWKQSHFSTALNIRLLPDRCSELHPTGHTDSVTRRTRRGAWAWASSHPAKQKTNEKHQPLYHPAPRPGGQCPPQLRPPCSSQGEHTVHTNQSSWLGPRCHICLCSVW